MVIEMIPVTRSLSTKTSGSRTKLKDIDFDVRSSDIITIYEFACLQGQIHNETKNTHFVLCRITIYEFACLQGQIHNETKNMQNE
jgi:hypothetical protein